MRRGAGNWWIAGLVGLALLRAVPATAESELTIYYHERPPYSTKQPDGSVRGVLADITDTIMKTAGIAYRWRELPSARQIEMIQRNDAPVCAIGWFKRPDREVFAKFTAPIYHDPPSVIVARANDDRFAGAPTIDTLFRNKNLLLLIKTGYSYGAEIDAKMASERPNLRRDPSDNRAMLVMVSRKRVDYMIMPAEEAKVLLADPDLGKGIAIYPFGHPPQGEMRYLMCSRSVPDALIARINQAIQPPQ
jgi:uncharacterized protein (TIGR02285 family)